MNPQRCKPQFKAEGVRQVFERGYSVAETATPRQALDRVGQRMLVFAQLRRRGCFRRGPTAKSTISAREDHREMHDRPGAFPAHAMVCGFGDAEASTKPVSSFFSANPGRRPCSLRWRFCKQPRLR